MPVGGNKVRKLEFLMADAVANGADCVITIGSIQSNHCCATAVAAKYLNLDCYLILSTPKVLLDKNPGLTGNLLVDCLVGARVVFAAREECAKVRSMVCCVSFLVSIAFFIGSIAVMLKYPEPFTSKVQIGEAYQAEVPDWTPLSEVETDDGDCSVAVVLDPSPSDCAGPPPQMASENGIASRRRKLEMVESPGICF
ncbi:hypothetical protein COP1_016005 [Malus domestica]